MIGSRLIKSNDTAAGCENIVDNYDPFGGNGVALYQLNGNANDVSGNYNGIWSGTEAYGTGVFGQAGVFDGSSSYVNLGATNQFQSPQVTISLWIKPTSFSGQIIIGNGNGGSFEEGDFYIGFGTSGYISYEIGISASIYEAKVCTTTQLQLNAWNNVVLVLNSSLGTNISKIYVNNIEQSLVDGYPSGGTFSGNLLIGTLQLNLGKRNISGNELWYGGSIDQVRIFNTALTPLEVEALYTEELCICDGTVDTLDILGDGSCIATYQLDGNANDLSGNYSGTPTDVSYGVGEFDLAGVFNGSTSSINTGFAQNTSNAFSWSFWFNGNSTQAAIPLIIDTTSSTSPYPGIGVGYEGGTAYVFISGGTVVPGASVSPNTWAHVVLTHDGSGNFSFYVNNTPIFTNISRISNLYSGQNILLGNTTVWNKFNGSIDQVRIFNKALSPEEVTTLYDETACTQPTNGTVPDPVSLTDTGVTKTGNMSINVRGFDISDDGQHLALNNYTAGNLEEWNMSTPYSLSTATLSEEFISAGYDILYSPDGNWFYTQNIDFNYVLHYYQLTTTNGGWVGNHGAKTSTGYNMLRSNENTLGITVDGEFLWYIDNNTKTFYKSFFSTPFDPSTLGNFQAFPLPSLLQYVRSLRFTNQGNRIYFTQANNPSAPGDESIYVYNLSIPYNLNSTLTYVNNFTNDTFVAKFWTISDNEGKIYTTTKSSAYTIKEYSVNT